MTRTVAAITLDASAPAVTRPNAIAPDRAVRPPRRLRVGAVVVVVMCAHAAVLTSLELPREPSGRGQAVVSSALIVRQVLVPVVHEVAVPAVHEVAVRAAHEVAVRAAHDGAVSAVHEGAVSAAHQVAVPAQHPVDADAARRDATPAGTTNATPIASRTAAGAAPRIVVATAKPTPASRDKPQRAALDRRTAAAVSSARAHPPAAAIALPEPQPHRAANEAAVQTADAAEGEPGANAADALLPDHLLRSLPIYAVRLPPSQRLHFRVSRGDARGQGTLDWSLHDDGRYNAALRLRGEGMPGVDWTSEGAAAGDAGVQPRRMVAHRKGRAVAAANFAIDEQKVSFSGARVERPFMRGGQDRLTWMLQLAGVLEARAQPLRVDERIVLYVVGPRGAADLWQWRVAGRETLGEGDSAVPAVKLVRDAQRLYDTEIELWLDPAHHHLPLKWRQQQRGVERPALEWERVPG